MLSTLKIKTTSGPDGLSSHMLRNTAAVIAASLSNLFNLSLSSGVVPFEWKLSNVTPAYKGSGDQKINVLPTTGQFPYYHLSQRY